MSLPTVAIIGGGYSGLTSAIQLKKKLGISAQIFEATNDIGGTWHYNTYPGCASDIPSHVYSFSFEMNPNWSQKYSPQPETQAYIQYVAKKYDVLKQVQLETRVVRATWIEEKKKWEIELSQPSVHKENQIKYFDFIFCGIGPLRVPNIPEQFTKFEGKTIHSAEWDNDYDFNNKRVAIIGSGTSSIQIVPNILDKVGHLYSFQRTPSWVGPREQFTYPNYVKFCFAYIPFVMLLYRAYLFFLLEYSFTSWGDAKSKAASDSRANTEKYMRDVLTKNGREDLIPKLIPDFPVGCKRICVSDEYLASLCSPKATVNFSRIETVQGRTITTADGLSAEVDTLILATGFDISGFMGNLKVYGKDGLSLSKLWDEELPKTFNSVSIHNFPNFFILFGPASVLGHNSVLAIIESQVEYGITMMKYMIKNQITSMHPTEKAQNQFYDSIQDKLDGTVWKAGCKSWYMDKDGKISTIWPDTVMKFRSMLKTLNYETDFSRD